ncbi:hypothetical protein CEXT_344481 [Caerostris extrusa]|uniref:Uncharacterized protein n=1 Tax=Caerostris extrusa TaxID=172846 RepID=A0AAV4WKB0_CAEEX|nr:hypothetical protein CEXT_344481 [Caerostris extrusa]
MLLNDALKKSSPEQQWRRKSIEKRAVKTTSILSSQTLLRHSSSKHKNGQQKVKRPVKYDIGVCHVCGDTSEPKPFC